MSSDPSNVELSVLRAFSPLDGLKNENLRALARKTAIRDLPQGRVLFKEGDKEKRTYYLASGEVELLSNGRVIGMIRGGTTDARHPLAPILPRRCTARVASDKIEYLSIDSDLLDVLITWDQTGIYEVGELRAGSESSDDWMTMLLQSRAFHRIPPANLQAVFLRLQRMNYSAGDVVIRQGEEGDFFYVIVSGRCSVSRETPLNREGIRLAELGIGETFGEEALISGASRNATVTMLTDGVLMRLAKDDFNTLLNEPMLHWVDHEAGPADRGQGRRLARRAPAERIRALSPRAVAQRAALLHPPEDQDARSGDPLRRGLRQRPSQLCRGLHPERTGLRYVRVAGRHCHHRSRRYAEQDE